MAAKTKEWKWTAKTEKAAQLVADDELSDVQIAEQTGIAKSTLESWKHRPEFVSRVSEIIEELGNQLNRYWVARRDKRMKTYNDVATKILVVIAERAEYQKTEHVPGGKTGLVVDTVEGIGSGDYVTVYEVDAGLLTELRNTLQQAAREAGQWTEKRDVTSNGKAVKGIALEEMTDDELKRIIEDGEGGAS